MNIIQQLVIDGELNVALDKLMDYTTNSREANMVILLQSRWATWKRAEAKGVTGEAQNLSLIKIKDAILSVASNYDLPEAPAPKATKTEQKHPVSAAKIYFSYAWGDQREAGESREKIVDELYVALKEDGFTIIRDKMDLGYGGLISKFMEEIGEGDLIVVFVSEKYAKSPYCMFELYEIARNNRWDKEAFTKRILPVPVEFIHFGDPDVLDYYFDYWGKQEQKWAAFLQKRIGQISEAQSKKYHNIKDIHQNFGKLSDWLIDINSSTTSLLKENDFQQVKAAILARLGNS
ncbi:MAG: TIR domain-containing protein [Saprospiraceae bacterium]